MSLCDHLVVEDSDFQHFPEHLIMPLKGNPISMFMSSRVLGECKVLAHLDLGNNQIGAAGAGVLASVLGGCKVLTHLDLGNNRIGAEGAVVLA